MEPINSNSERYPGALPQTLRGRQEMEAPADEPVIICNDVFESTQKSQASQNVEPIQPDPKMRADGWPAIFPIEQWLLG